MNGLHKVRFVTHGTETHVFLDDQEVRGCTAANFDYQIDALPVVKLELNAVDIVVEADQVVVDHTMTKEEKDVLTRFINRTGRKNKKCASEVTRDDIVQYYNIIVSGKEGTLYFGEKRMVMIRNILERKGYQFNDSGMIVTEAKGDE